MYLEEEHVDWIESQLTLIDHVGLPKYPAAQIQESSA